MTSIGFFELAIAAPSMKAALEAWGSKNNLFHQGFAKETQDPTITAATMATPGVVLRRAVGSNDTFSRNAALPQDLGIAPVKQKTKKERPAAKEPQARKLGDKATVAAARAFDRERRRRERKHVKEAAAREKRRKQRELTIAKAETALEQAKRLHETKIQEIEDARSLEQLYMVVTRRATTMQADPYSGGFCTTFKFSARVGDNVICPGAGRLLRIQ